MENKIKKCEIQAVRSPPLILLIYSNKKPNNMKTSQMREKNLK